MKRKIILYTLLTLGIFALCNSNQRSLIAMEEEICDIDVGKANTPLEMLDVATRELTLNTNLDTIVNNISLPTKGLYQTSVSWSENSEYIQIDETNNIAIITRPEANNEDVKAELIATLTLVNGKNSTLTKNKTFNLTILPKKSSSSSESDSVSYLNEDFSSYALGDDIGEYLAWNLNVSEGQTEIVDSIPNNDCISSKALKIKSLKSATEVRYIASFYATKTIVMEGYVLLNDEVNGIHFDLGANDSYGPSFGLSNSGFYYYDNGDKLLSESKYGKPKEDVWYKFRIEANTSWRTYSIGIYQMDGENTLLFENNIAYPTSNKYLNKFRIRIEGGDKVGEVYLSNISMGLKDDMPIFEGENPNREDGIGTIDNFNDSVLFMEGEIADYDKNFIIHNRFNDEMIYEENIDYTIEKECVSNSEKLEINKYHIVLLKTNETKDLIQKVYKSSQVDLPTIEDFKTSHLAQKVLDSAGTLSTTGSISFEGKTNIKNGTVYYGLKLHDENELSYLDIKENKNLLKSGSFKQESRDIYFEIESLVLTNSYDLYVFIENENGVSPLYHEKDISTIINISTCEQFYDMTVNVNTYKNEFRLVNDLDFKDYTWKYDPTTILKWKGYFDGQGYTIYNLTISSPFRKAAIFAEITNGTVKNLNIVNANVSGLQDSAIICGYSNGADISNINISDSNVFYNNNDGSEGYFAIICGRLFEGTTNMENICITNSKIICNKYTGALTGNVNKDHNCVLNANNIYCDVVFNCEGAAVGLIGRNRGTSNLNNIVAIINIESAKKEMGVVAGHNKEGGKLNVKNLIGYLAVKECAQPTYFNYFIGSHDPNTSSYTFENVYFIGGDYASVTDNFSPTSTTRSAGKVYSYLISKDAKWFEENTFIEAFEIDPLWSFDEKTSMPIYDLNKKISLSANDVNELIKNIKKDYSSNDHYYIRKASILYDYLDKEEKEKVDKEKLDKYINEYNEYYEKINSLSELGGLY